MVGCRAHDYGRSTPANIARLLHEDGWEGGQIAVQKLINGFNSFAEITPAICEEIYREFQKYGMTTPVLGYYIQPQLADKEARMEQVRLFKCGLDHSLLMGGAYVATETGNFPINGPMSARRPLFENVVDTFLRCADHATKIGAQIAVEPAVPHTLGTIELVLELLERVDAPCMHIIFDPVNMLVPEGLADQQSYWQKHFDAFGDKIVVCHIKDGHYVGDKFEEVKLGRGVIDFDVLFKWLNKNKPGIPLLREWTAPDRAKDEADFLRMMCAKQF